MNQGIGQLEIQYGLFIHSGIEVLLRRVKGHMPVVMVKHGSRPIKSEPVKVEFLQPVADIGKEKLLHFPFAVVEQLGIPALVVASCTGMEVLIGTSVKFIETFEDVFHRMGMHDVHDDGNPHFMGGVDQAFELLRCPKSGRRSKEIGDMVAEGTVIRMFHHGHHLDGSVASGFDSGEDQFFEFLVGADPEFFLSHAHVAFVDQGHLSRLFQGKMLICPSKITFGKPELPGKVVGFFVLNHPSDVGRNPVEVSIIGSDDPNFDLAAVNKGMLVWVKGKENLPIPAVILF